MISMLTTLGDDAQLYYNTAVKSKTSRELSNDDIDADEDDAW